MQTIILRNIPSLCNDTVTQSLATRFAERHANVIAALQRIVPTILRAFADRSKEGTEVPMSLLQMGEHSLPIGWHKPLACIDDAGSLQRGHEMLQQLFGKYNIDTIAREIAAKTMVRISTVVRLMQWVAPFCIGAIRKVMAERRLDATMLNAWLQEESFELVDETTPTLATYNKPKASSIKRRKDYAWAYFGVLLLVGGLLYWILRG